MLRNRLKAILGKEKNKMSVKNSETPRLSGFELKLPMNGGFRARDRISLYRFLVDNIPILNGAIWLWTRLCAAPVEFKFDRLPEAQAARFIKEIDRVLIPTSYQKSGGIETLVSGFFRTLFIDGCFGGQAILNASGNGLAGFKQYDNRYLSFEKQSSGWRLYCETDNAKVSLEPSSFYFTALDSQADDPRGASLLSSIEFISHLEQKLIFDMAENLERSGYQRIQVQLKKPERAPGESEANYIQRANNYFDSTVELFKNLRPADSAVTWDDVQITAVGPGGQGAASSWYLYHRALIENICAGVHLDPFMLGYSFGTTQTWAKFKFELMMRQIVAVQEKAKGFLQWLLDLEMALRGLPGNIEIVFDNRRVFGSLERFQAEKIAADSIIGQFNAGLLSREEAREKIDKIEPGVV
ncbi:MAG: hypothetical protein GX409_11190 [candidate division Zixibacteria bacterium]|jgi:hypothetical protein|nr:hypothetical protein [candidate division Zixibacteria bacterium]